MRKLLLLLMLATAPFVAIGGPKDKKGSKKGAADELTLEKIWASPAFSPRYVYGIHMLDDGTYSRLIFDNTQLSYVILKYHFEQDAPLDTLFNSKYLPELGADFVLEDYKVSPSGGYVLLQTNSSTIYRHSRESNFMVYSIKKNKVKKLQDGEPIMYAGFSPLDYLVAYVYKNNLYVENFKSNTTLQVTKDGEMNKIINGRTDWVYEEEFGLVQGYQWSPTGDRLAYYKFDESAVKEYQLMEYDSIYPSALKYKYPKAGEDNSKVSIWVYDLRTQKPVKMDAGQVTDQYIPRIKWTRDNNTLAIERLNRGQNHFELLLADAASGKSKVVYSEQNNTYIDINDNLYFLKDNSFILTSEKGPYNQIYWHNAAGGQERNVTQFPFDVIEILDIDEEKNLIYYTANDPGPLVKAVFQVNLDGTGRQILPAEQKGSSTAEFSKDFRYFILTTSATLSPPVVSVYKTGGDKIRTVEDNESLRNKIREMNFMPKEYLKIPIGESAYLNGWMIKPPGFKAKNKYPVIIHIYGGPGHNTVTNSWNGAWDIWYQYMAQKGYIVVSVDNRGTLGRGTEWERATYKRLGQIESDDQILAARYLGSLGYVDKERIGIFGWSFGGYLSSMCLMKGVGLYKMAVAVAPVTDWRFYDNIYTERYMQRPKDNPQGYAATSVLKYVPNLKGKFLLIHGTFDDNVHPQNSMELVKEMVKQNKKFDSEFYPDKNHGISGGFTRLHLINRITDYILENL